MLTDSLESRCDFRENLTLLFAMQKCYTILTIKEQESLQWD
jgi:hypothetical protein